MPFNIMNLATRELYRGSDGEPVEFPDADATKDAVNSLMALTGQKHQPRPVKVDPTKWHKREQQRFADGTYTRLPWDVYADDSSPSHILYRQDYWFYSYRKPEAKFHFAHVSNTKQGQIAFTASGEKGVADQQTTMAPGRYLQTFYDGLSSRNITHLANEFLSIHGAVELQFARTEDEIEDVYINGPESCMSKEAENYRSDEHPSRVYGLDDHGDISVAYLVNTTDDGESIVARCIVWEDKKVFGRCYGDIGKLEQTLKREGYQCDSDGCLFNGARLHKIECRHSFIMPYLDWDYGLDDAGDHFVMRPRDTGRWARCLRTDGLLEDKSFHCPHCDEWTTHDGRNNVEDAAQIWCIECIKNGAFYCAYTGNIYSTDIPSVEMHNGQRWCERFFKKYGFTCGYDGRNYHNDAGRVQMHDGSIWTKRNFRYYGRYCVCGANIPADYKCECQAQPATQAAQQSAQQSAQQINPNPYGALGSQGTSYQDQYLSLFDPFNLPRW